MTTLGKIFVVSQFILSVAFAVVAGMFLAHRLPWNPPTPGGAGATAVPGLIEQHEKKIKELVVAADRANARLALYSAGLAGNGQQIGLERERQERQRLFDEKLTILRTGADSKKVAVPQPVTVIGYDPATGRLKLTGTEPIQFRGKDLMAFDPTIAEYRRLHRSEIVNGVAMLGPIPETEKEIETLLKTYNGLTVDINGEGPTRGLRKEIALQEEAGRNAVAERDHLKPFLANRYSETLLLLQRQNQLLSRKQELQKIGVASGAQP
jgi:hypothetical protein